MTFKDVKKLKNEDLIDFLMLSVALGERKEEIEKYKIELLLRLKKQKNGDD